MHFYEQCLTRLLGSMGSYAILSLAYSLVSLAFQIPFSNTGPHPDTQVVSIPDAYGKGSFVVYWMLNFVGMYALGLASENVTMIIGQPFTALWLSKQTCHNHLFYADKKQSSGCKFASNRSML